MHGPITNIPPSILKYWESILFNEEEIINVYIDDVIYIGASFKQECVDPLKVYKSRNLGKLIYGDLYIYVNRNFYYKNKDCYVPLKEFERLIKLKAFL
jgi:hypothetical protein